MPPGDDAVDFTNTTRWMEDQAKRGRLPGGTGDPPHDGGAEDVLRRVGALESAVSKMDGKVDTLIKDVAEIKGRLSQMPTTFQMLTWFVGIAMALSIGLTGLVFSIARSVGTH